LPSKGLKSDFFSKLTVYNLKKLIRNSSSLRCQGHVYFWKL